MRTWSQNFLKTARREPIDVDNLDLSIPDGVSLDPVRMYLKEIGKCRFPGRGN